MPNYSEYHVGQMRTFLERQKGVQLIEEFNQTSFREKIAMAVTRPSENQASSIVAKAVTITKNSGTPQQVQETHPFDGGYCNGVATDWIRRMLLAGATPTAEKATYRHAEVERKLPTIYGNDTQAKIDDKLLFSDEARGLDAVRQRAYRSAERMGSAWYEMNQLNWYGPVETKRTLKAEDWQDVAKKLDAEMIQSRQADDRLGNARAQNKEKIAPRKKFTNLGLVASGSQNYAKPGQWSAALDDVILANSAAKLGFSVPQSSGHAIAVWRKGESKDTNDSYWVLDPNLGVFSANHEGMKLILQILFWYESGHTPFYDTCASVDKGTRVNYMVWKRI